jgi:hypothetical protein
MFRIILGFAVLFLCLPINLRAQEEPSGPTEMVLTPRSPSPPSLRYRLLPSLRDQQPGDALPLYRAVGEDLESNPVRNAERLSQWQKTPLGDLPRREVKELLLEYKNHLDKVDRAARLESCNSDLSSRLRKEGVATLLPEVQGLRHAGLLLAVRARLEMAEGRYDDAVWTLRAGFILAKRIGEAPCLICHLVGCAIAQIMIEQLETFIQQPDAPNLYWALTDLPRPLLDPRKPLEGERLGAYGTFPGMIDSASNLKAGPMTPKQVQECIKGLGETMSLIGGISNRTLLALLIRSKHQTAKKVLIAHGRPKELVERMPHVQVALLHSFAQYDELFDEIEKGRTLPYPQMWREMEKAAEKVDRVTKSTVNAPAIPLARYLLPAVVRVDRAHVRVDRKVAALRCLEALRLHTDQHGGELPVSLAAITEVPLPVDPITGRPFRYRRTGDHQATLTGARFEKDTSRDHLDYVIHLRTEKQEE